MNLRGFSFSTARVSATRRQDHKLQRDPNALEGDGFAQEGESPCAYHGFL